MSSGSKLTVAVVGATGVVGVELLRLLEERRFPVGRLLAFSSGRQHASVVFKGKKLPAPGVTRPALEASDVVFFVSSDEVSKKFAPALAKKGIWAIDDSSAFRLDSDVPLIIPEVNGDRLKRNQRLIAGPNCTLTGAAVAGAPLIKAAGARSARIASYQAVSGAGKAALQEFLDQLKQLSPLPDTWQKLLHKTSAFTNSALPHPIALNVFPQVGGFDGDGHSSEEKKIAFELRKIWMLPDLPISATAVRVPVVRGHSLSFWLELKKPLTPAKARTLLSRAPGVKHWKNGSYPTPLSAGSSDPVHVGRVRQGASPRELCLWVVSDNLLKGAALNSIQIAELLIRKGWL